MSEKIDRTGETVVNTFGSKMVIIDYRNARDIDVYFPQYNWTFYNANYTAFKKGNVRCPYDKSIYEVGYLGEGKNKAYENRKATKVYRTWKSMLQRCYSEEYHKKKPTYIGCETCKEWLNFQEYGKWFERNYYKIEGEQMCLDKDILVKHNKIYSPETCIFVPNTINVLFTKSDKTRGESLIGTSPRKNGKYEAQCQIFNPEIGKSKKEHLGFYDTQEKAFEVYKQFKENYIKQVADYYKNKIPQKLYHAMYSYEVEIND